jgi:ketosteroid isomerase-like protein
MKTPASRYVWISCLLAWFAVPALAPAADPREADHEALRQLMVRTTTAINNKDLKDLGAIFSPEFVFTSVDQTVITNRPQLAAYFERLLRPEAPVANVTMSPSADVRTRFVDANTGYCFGSSIDVYTLKDDRIVRIPSRWTATLVKENGEWHLAAVHTGVNFVNNPVLEARSLSFWRKLGILLHLSKPPYETP